MRQAGIIAAGALYALEHNIERLVEDHQNARLLAEAIRRSPGLALDPEYVDTNIVFFTVDEDMGTAAAFAARLRDEGVWTMPTAPQKIRMVTHLDVSREQAEHAGRVIQDVAAEAMSAVG
jgi:threonine aldolase